MIEKEVDDGGRFIDFTPVLVTNSLPFAEIVLSDTSITINMVFLLYWFEILTLFLVYCGCALFAQQERVADGQRRERMMECSAHCRPSSSIGRCLLSNFETWG